MSGDEDVTPQHPSPGESGSLPESGLPEGAGRPAEPGLSEGAGLPEGAALPAGTALPAEPGPPVGEGAPDAAVVPVGLEDLSPMPGDEHLDALLAAPVIPDLPPELDPDLPNRSEGAPDATTPVPSDGIGAASAPPVPTTRASARAVASSADPVGTPEPPAPSPWEGVQDSSATASPRSYRAWTAVIFAGLTVLLAGAIALIAYLATQPLPFG